MAYSRLQTIKPPDSHPIFNGLRHDELNSIKTIANIKTFKPQDYLFHYNAPANYVYILDRGVMLMERSATSGKRQVLAFMYPGNFIGVPYNECYPFNVQSVTHSTLIEIPRAPFMAMAEDSKSLRHNLHVVGSNILAYALDQIYTLGQKKAHERICCLLNQIRNRSPHNQSIEINLVMSRQDIADHLGLTMETVSRGFSKLKRDGIIAIHSAHIVHILDVEKLQQYAIAQ